MIQPPRAIQVLLVEDSEDDAALLLRELRRGGYDPQSRRAASADAFEDALESQAWDVILCDYTMPGFSGAEALALLHKRKLDIPFIFVSGTLSEEMAVAAIRAGAQDRSDERRVGKECVSKCRSRWSTVH